MLRKSEWSAKFIWKHKINFNHTKLCKLCHDFMLQDSGTLLLCDPPHGFQSQVGSLAFPYCLHMVNLRITSGATAAFCTNMGVRCIQYTAGLPSRHPSCKQQRAGSRGLLTWGTVRFDLGLPALQANVLSTRPRRLAYMFNCTL